MATLQHSIPPAFQNPPTELCPICMQPRHEPGFVQDGGRRTLCQNPFHRKAETDGAE
jgi:hypothetical protein